MRQFSAPLAPETNLCTHIVASSSVHPTTAIDLRSRMVAMFLESRVFRELQLFPTLAARFTWLSTRFHYTSRVMNANVPDLVPDAG